MSNQEGERVGDVLETLPPRVRDEETRSQADVTPEPAPPLDETDVQPLTDPDETKGG
jgi:hypothetical protein